MNKYLPVIGIAIVVSAVGCTPTIKTQNEITIKPIELNINVDVNFVDKQLQETEKKEVKIKKNYFKEKLAPYFKNKSIGEGNNGQVVILIPDSQASDQLKATVKEANDYRNLMYAQVAKKQNIPVAFVAQRGALWIAERAEVGTLLQTAEGEWGEKQ